MKILAVECSAKACSCAVIDDGIICADFFINIKLTHSQTLMPMIKSMLDALNCGIKDIDAFAVAAGPGSFTGIRIGISAVKGLATPDNKPCIPVSTLSAMAENHKNSRGIICCVMDARCNQVYNAIFEYNGKELIRKTQDRAILIEDLAKELEIKYNDKDITVVGDGTDVFMPFAKELNNVSACDIVTRYQNASGVALAAENAYKNGDYCAPEELLPVYLRLPQAERELKAKHEGK